MPAHRTSHASQRHTPYRTALCALGALMVFAAAPAGAIGGGSLVAAQAQTAPRPAA